MNAWRGRDDQVATRGVGLQLGLDPGDDVGVGGADDLDVDAVLLLEGGAESVELVEALARVDGDAAFLLGRGDQLLERGIGVAAGLARRSPPWSRSPPRPSWPWHRRLRRRRRTPRRRAPGRATRPSAHSAPWVRRARGSPLGAAAPRHASTLIAHDDMVHPAEVSSVTSSFLTSSRTRSGPGLRRGRNAGSWGGGTAPAPDQSSL